MDFMEALELLGQRVPVACTVDDGDPVVYKVELIDHLGEEELTVNGEIKHFRDFCFSPSQILFGKWRRWGSKD